MKDRLSCNFSDVRTNVESFNRRVFFRNHVSYLSKELAASLQLIGRQREEVWGVSERDNERMTTCNGESVPEGVRQAVLQADVIC